jgi:hypothetical protein
MEFNHQMSFAFAHHAMDTDVIRSVTIIALGMGVTMAAVFRFS